MSERIRLEAVQQGDEWFVRGMDPGGHPQEAASAMIPDLAGPFTREEAFAIIDKNPGGLDDVAEHAEVDDEVDEDESDSDPDAPE